MEPKSAKGKSFITGIVANAHLDDQSLQQFVCSKTNRPVPFSYFPFPVGRQQIGVLMFPVTNQRPFYLNSDFGLLKRNVVYIRRGSSTAEASPDEVLSMAAKASGRPQATISANNLRSPLTVSLKIELRPQVFQITVAQIVQFAKKSLS
jgi:hypothetical protein